MADDSKKYLILVDDGWRYEKLEVLRYLKDHIEFDVVTHDPETQEALRDEFPVRFLEPDSPKEHPLYLPLMFFASEVQTNNIRYRERIRYYRSPWYKRLLLKLHAVAARCIGRRLRYPDVLRIVYRHSHQYADLLKEYDVFVFTPVAIQDKRILYEAANAGLEVVAWVYSWDNPMKDNELFPDADRYLVWNEHNAEDLHRLHGIPTSKARITGPVQFDYLLETSVLTGQTSGPRYVLFACAMNRPQYLDQEVLIIRMIARHLKSLDPEIQLVVRPYPFPMAYHEGQTDPYRSLKYLANVSVAGYGTEKDGKRLITRADLLEKIAQIAEAECLINLGSTIGMEAAFTDTPIIQLAFNVPHSYPPWLDIMEVMKNDHLQYILESRFPNVVHDEKALSKALADVLSGNVEPYMEYTEHLKAYVCPLEVGCYKAELLKHLTDSHC